MSLSSKVVLGLSCAFSVSIIAYVHVKQNVDKDKLHQGVIRDVETQQRKIMNTLALQKQQDLKKHLENRLAYEQEAMTKDNTL